MKIKKVRKQEMVTKIFMINQNLKILHTASFFLAELTVSALLIILQSSCYFLNIVMACLTFY